MIRVVLADDETMVRAGVRGILATDPEIEVVAEASDGLEAIELVAEHRPDVAVLDIRMPACDGFVAAERICGTTAVVMLTTFAESEYIARALRAGASGFLVKSGDPRELIAGVHAVADGAAYFAPHAAGTVIGSFGGDRLARGDAARRRIEPLSERERQVLALLAAGRSNQEIGRELFLVEGTVKGYVSAILNRLEVRNRVQAAIIAYEAGLVEAPG